MLLLRRTLFLILILAYLCALLISCSATDGKSTDGADDEDSPSLDGIVPNAVNFSEITYSRPDTEALSEKLSELTFLVTNGGAQSQEIASELNEAVADYLDYSSMLSYAALMYAKNDADTYYLQEFRELRKDYPELLVKKEQLAYAIITSPVKNELPTLGFDDTTVTKIDSAHEVNEDFFNLLLEEEELKCEFDLLSKSTVNITFGGITDSYASTVERLKTSFDVHSMHFTRALEECSNLYERELDRSRCDIFVRLVKVRTLIAASLGYESYNDYAYDVLNYEHTEDAYKEFSEDIFEYLLPVYSDISLKIFNPYFNNHIPKLLDKNTVIGNILKVYKGLDSTLYNAFGAMISAKLYDIAPKSEERCNDSRTLYFGHKCAPFIFLTAFGDARDYGAISYEFSSYYSILKAGSASVDPLSAEIGAKALEMITLSGLAKTLDKENEKYLYYLSTKDTLNQIIYSGFLSIVEHEIYDMSYGDISLASVNALIESVAAECSLTSHRLSDIITRDLVTAPHRTQCKAMSTFYAAELFSADESSAIDFYNAVIGDRGDASLKSVINGFGVPSPFGENAVMDFADRIFYSINGYHYYKSNSDFGNVA